MRQLDTCDFCGEHPEGVYEVVPESLAGGPQRLALCAPCRETLQSVVDPLLDAADGGSTNESSHSDAGGDAATRTDQQARDSAETTGEQQPASASTSTEGSSSQPDVSMPNETQSADVATTDKAESTESATTDQAAAEPPAAKPDGYAQVLRLLQNRDEAMPRDDLRALATNAYELRDRTFEQAVDAGIENGDVEETADGLHTR